MNYKAMGLSFMFSVIILGSCIIGYIAKSTYDTAMGKVDIGEGIHLSDIKARDNSTIIYDDAGKIIYKNENGKRSVPIKIEKVPKSVYGAIISLEDVRFFQHNGIDLYGIGRAIVNNLKEKGLSEGASTLTQQVIKINYLSSEKTWTRKIKEQLLAMQLEKRASKFEILEAYLNSAYFAHGNYGLGAASEFYFGKKAYELNPDEAAVISGITQFPSKYSPYLHPKYAKEKARVTLKKMLNSNYITSSQYNKYKSLPCMKRLMKRDLNNPNIKTTFYVDAVLKQVRNDLIEKYGEDRAYELLYKEGVRINSGFNQKAQKAVDSVYNHSQAPIYYTSTYLLRKNGKEIYKYAKTDTVTQARVKAESYKRKGYYVIYETIQQPQGASIVVDNKTQRVIAMAGLIGNKVFSGELNRATDSVRQPGSSIKPLASYTAAFQAGYIPSTKILDEKINIGGFSPKNWYNSFKGTVDMKSALAVSMNIPAVKIADEVGVSKILTNLTNYGITTITPEDSNLAISIGGFSKGVKLVEMTKAYSSIANKGNFKTAKYYTKVTDNSKKTLLYDEQKSRQVISEKVASYLTSCMSAVVERPFPNGTANMSNLSNSRIDQACKSGTTDDSKDNWLIGFTRDYTIGMWQGYDTPKKMVNRSRYPSLNWKKIMTVLMSDVKSAKLTMSDGDSKGLTSFKSDEGRTYSKPTQPTHKETKPVMDKPIITPKPEEPDEVTPPVNEDATDTEEVITEPEEEVVPEEEDSVQE